MSTPNWTFTPLSRSLMSLLASRTHEWRTWSIAEGGAGPVAPANVAWVEVTVEMAGQTKVVRRSDPASAQAIEVYGELQKSAEVEVQLPSGEWKLVWQSAGFLSEIALAPLATVAGTGAWKLARGSHMQPSLYRATRASV